MAELVYHKVRIVDLLALLLPRTLELTKIVFIRNAKRCSES